MGTAYTLFHHENSMVAAVLLYALLHSRWNIVSKSIFFRAQPYTLEKGKCCRNAYLGVISRTSDVELCICSTWFLYNLSISPTLRKKHNLPRHFPHTAAVARNRVLCVCKHVGDKLFEVIYVRH